MLKIYVTKLIIPLVFIFSMLSIPFLWTPEVNNNFNKISQQETFEKKSIHRENSSILQNSSFQKYMTLGFLVILILVTICGFMLYGILKHQRIQWQKRFPKEQKK